MRSSIPMTSGRTATTDTFSIPCQLISTSMMGATPSMLLEPSSLGQLRRPIRSDPQIANLLGTNEVPGGTHSTMEITKTPPKLRPHPVAFSVTIRTSRNVKDSN